MKMKNKILTELLILLLALLFSACGSSLNSGTGSEGSGSTSRETEGTAAANQVVIYEKDDLTLKLSQEYLPTESDRSCYLIGEFSGNGKRSYEISEVIVNGTLKSDGGYSYLDEETQVRYTRLDNLAEDMQLEGIQNWESVSFHLKVTDEEYEVLEDSDRTVTLSGIPAYAAYGNLSVSSQVEGQILLETEDLRLTAVYFGNPPAHSSDTYVVLKAENLSNREIPVRLQEISVNHITVDSSASGETIPAGKTAYLEGYIYGSELEKLGIGTYQNLQLLISTSRSENNGGGIWYGLNLDGGEEEEWNPENYVLLDSFEGVSVYYKKDSCSTKMLSNTSYSSINYNWELMIVNEGNENIELSVDDETADENSDDNFDHYSMLTRTTAGPGDRVPASLVYHMKNPSYINEFTFSIRYFKKGKVELLGTSDPITLDVELNAIDTAEDVQIYPLGWTWDYENDLDICYLAAVNETDQEVTIELAGLRRGSVDYMEDSETEMNYLENRTISPNSSQVITLQLPKANWEDMDSDIEVKFIYSSNGKVLYESKDYETISSE